VNTSLRLCMVTTFYPPYHFGGDALAVQRLARALAQAGHDVTVIHDADAFHAMGGHADDVVPDATDQYGVHVVRLESRAQGLSVLLTQQLGRPVMHARRLRALLENDPFDVVHFHNISLIGGPGILALGGEAVRIYSAHEHWLVCPTHVLWRHGREVCTGRQCLRCVMRTGRPPQLWRYTHLLARALENVDAFIAMSEFSRDKHHEFGFPRDMEVLPGFLPDDAATELAVARPHERPYVLFAGRLERIKGLDDVIPLFRDVTDVDLIIAGSGAHEAALRRLAADAPGVRFVGQVSEHELDAYYRHALALIAPSVCFETFGLTLIEAFKHGTPVIARRIGPYPEIVSQARGGLIYDGPNELVAAIRRLQFEPGLRASLSAAARAAMAQRWTASVVLPQYLEIVRRASARRMSRGAA
jgi:glycosyltransferase involved in cell wall biosynthesis